LYIALNLTQQVRKVRKVVKGVARLKRKTGVIRQGSVGNLSHNRREIEGEKHIDYTRENIVLVRQTLQEAYAEAFGAAVEEYNSGQKRKDRRIDDYYKHLFKCDYSPVVQEAAKRGKNKHAQKSFYENIIQIGNKYNSGVDSDDAPLVTECLKLWFEGCPELGIPSYQKRNPNIYVFEASVHVDEATPHIQLDYIPLAFVNEKGNGRLGLSVQNSHSRALAEMGFGDDKDSLIRWREHEVEKYLVPIMKSRGIEWVPPDKENKQEYQAPLEYREFMATKEAELVAVGVEIDTKTAELENVKVELSGYADLQVAVDDVSKIGTKSKLSKNIVVPPEEYALLQEQAKSYCANRDKIEKVNKLWVEAASANSKALKELKQAEESNREAIILRSKQVNLNVHATRLEESERQLKTRNKACMETIADLRRDNRDIAADKEKEVARVKQMYQQQLLSEQKCAKTALDKEKAKVAELEKANAEKDKAIENLKAMCKRIYEVFKNAMQALQLLKYDDDKYKVEGLSKEQGTLIDSVVEYSVGWARTDGFHDIAKDMNDKIGISKGIQNEIDSRTKVKSMAR